MRSPWPGVQGSRMSLASDDPEHVIVVPGRHFAPTTSARVKVGKLGIIEGRLIAWPLLRLATRHPLRPVQKVRKIQSVSRPSISLPAST
jgi:hypothetical protein